MNKFFLASLDIGKFDKERMYQEIHPYLKLSLETGPEKRFKDRYADDVDVTYFENTGKIVKGTKAGYSVLSLTTSDLKYSEYGFNYLRNMKGFNWKWRENLDYTKSVVDSMPFKSYSIVKIISLPANGISVMHTDTDVYNQDSISLEIKTGGTKLDILYKDKIYNPSSECFIFDDSVLHGTKPPVSERVIMRVFGEFSENLHEFIDSSSVIYF